jgi:ankyrin repeat protein
MKSRRYVKLLLFLIFGNYVEAMDKILEEITEASKHLMPLHDMSLPLEELIEASGIRKFESSLTPEIVSPKLLPAVKSKKKHHSTSRRLKDIEKGQKNLLEISNKLTDQQLVLTTQLLQLAEKNSEFNENRTLKSSGPVSRDLPVSSTSFSRFKDQLLEAAEAGDEEKLLEALNAGVCPWIQDVDNNFTPLHYAAMRGHTKIVKILLARGQKLPICQHGKEATETPLRLATDRGHFDIVKLLTPASCTHSNSNS